MNIIGISAGYHDSACCLLQDGRLVAAVQEERFSRIKNDKSMPRQSFRYCLKRAGLSIADVDCLAYYEDPCLKLARQVWMGLGRGVGAQRRQAILQRLTRTPITQEIRSTLGYDGRLEIVDHHLSHAASSFYFSGFDEAAILTVDGVGDWPTTTYSRGAGAEIERLEAVEFPDSLGLFYSTITSYLGFEVNEGEYKVMGLAPYGRPRFAGQMRRLIESGSNGQYRLNMEYFAFLEQDCMYSPLLVELLGQPARTEASPVTQFHMDVARSAQFVLEEQMLEKVRYLHSLAPSDNLCMAGGVALNVVANARCRREGPFRNLFVQPAAGDAGGALGAAAVAQVRLSGKKRCDPLEHAYLGPSIDTDDVHELVQSAGISFHDYRHSQQQLLQAVVDRLLRGEVVAWCQGACEFGPRALGARSILADPRRPDMRDRINASVKKRESFRPFAPSVLAAEQRRHFDLDYDSPYMLEACQVASELDLPAITHVDGSARVHVVDERANPRFAALLQEFFVRTGCPLLLNTSFNLKGEPIVLTAVDALMCFASSALDSLVLDDFIVDRSAVTPLWQLVAQRRYAQNSTGRDSEVGHLVYTFL